MPLPAHFDPMIFAIEALYRVHRKPVYLWLHQGTRQTISTDPERLDFSGRNLSAYCPVWVINPFAIAPATAETIATTAV